MGLGEKGEWGEGMGEVFVLLRRGDEKDHQS
jgi:hypothetical protein